MVGFKLPRIGQPKRVTVNNAVKSVADEGKATTVSPESEAAEVASGSAPLTSATIDNEDADLDDVDINAQEDGVSDVDQENGLGPNDPAAVAGDQGPPPQDIPYEEGPLTARWRWAATRPLVQLETRAFGCGSGRSASPLTSTVGSPRPCAPRTPATTPTAAKTLTQATHAPRDAGFLGLPSLNPLDAGNGNSAQNQYDGKLTG